MNLMILFLLTAFTAGFWILIGTYSIAGLDALLKPKWIVPIKPSLAKLSQAIMPMWVLFLTVMLFRNSIFPWITETNLTAPFRAFYLTQNFFLLRGIFYLVLAGIYSRAIRLDRAVNASVTLILILFFGSLASFDWIMSVSASFHSTVFGLLMIVNGSLVAYAFSLTRLTEVSDESVLQDLNNIHLAMIALWTYLTVVQFLTVWSGNLPEEVIYFKERFHGFSGGLAGFILAAQALIPIPLLLFKSLKAKLSFTRKLAYWTLFIQCLHLWWLVGGTK